MNAPNSGIWGGYVTSTTLDNFRCFKHAEASFVYPGSGSKKGVAYPNINLILGTNASGKSALLKGIALSVIGPILNGSGFVSNMLVRKVPKDNSEAPSSVTTVHSGLIVRLQGSEQISEVNKTQVVNCSVYVQRKSDFEHVDGNHTANEIDALEPIYLNNSPSYFLVAYGATRRIEPGEVDLEQRQSKRSPRYQRVASLFEDYVALMPPATWMKQLYSIDRIEEALQLLDDVLPPEITPSHDGSISSPLMFEIHGTELPFSALADGYRSFIGWVGDLLFNLAVVTPAGMKLNELPGIVIVDEIDLHLHPSWQRVVVDRISKTFPKLQFFLTTHSPLVTGTLPKENILVCEIGEDGERQIVHPSVSPEGKSPDQLLTSDFFGLESVRSEKAEKKLSDIVAEASSGNVDAAVKYLKALSGDSESL